MAENYNITGLQTVRDEVGMNVYQLFMWYIRLNTAMVFQNMANTIENQDPSAKSLADALRRTDEIGAKVGEKYAQLGRAANESMTEFIDAVIANEQEAMFNVTEINDGLDNVASSLDDITF